MGSILAGTSLAERIEHVTMSVKDLFGSIFFISVGMMVQPDVIVQYWVPILILSLTVMVGPIIFGTFGMLLTGQPLKVAMQSGFSLTQIGEFAFIIATLGMSLGVLDAGIYPIVVAVSVLTTFTTPYFIKMADPAYKFVERHLPERLNFLIDRYSADASRAGGRNHVWTGILKRYIWRILLYSIVMIAIIILSRQYLQPELDRLMTERLARFVGVAATLAAMSPFLFALSTHTSSERERTILRKLHSNYIVPRVVMTTIRLLIALVFVAQVIGSAYSYTAGFIAGFVLLGVIIVVVYRTGLNVATIETNFMNNLNERELRRSGKNNTVVSDLHLAYMTVGYGSPVLGKRLIDSKLRSRYGVNVVAIQRGRHGIPVPDGETRLFPGDIIGVVGTEDQIASVLPQIERQGDETGDDAEAANFELTSIVLTERSPLLGLNIATADVRRKYHALIVSMQRDDTFYDDLKGITFEAGDILWAVGDPDHVNAMR